MQNRPPFQSPLANQQRSMSTPPQPMTPQPIPQPMTPQPIAQPMTPQPMRSNQPPPPMASQQPQPPQQQPQQPQPPQQPQQPQPQQPLPNQPFFRPQGSVPTQPTNFSRSSTPQMSRPGFQMTSGQFSPQLSSRSPSPGFPPPPTDKQMPQSPNIGNASPLGRHRHKYPEQMGKAYSNGPESLPNMNQGPAAPQQFFVPGNMGQQNMMQRDFVDPYFLGQRIVEELLDLDSYLEVILDHYCKLYPFVLDIYVYDDLMEKHYQYLDFVAFVYRLVVVGNLDLENEMITVVKIVHLSSGILVYSFVVYCFY